MARIGTIVIAGLLAGVGVVGVDVAPVVAGVSVDWKQIDAGDDHTCGVTTSGRLFCWGNDGSGQLGDGTVANPADNPSPVQVVGAATDWKQVSAGELHTCATKTNGRLFCWGLDDGGQLGDGIVASPLNNSGPAPVAGAVTNWKQVSAGDAHTCATKKSGRLFCWGNDGSGRLGDGTIANPTTNPIPVPLVGAATNWKQVSAGDAHTCATKKSGRLLCWGNDGSGRLGDGTVANPLGNPGPDQVVGHATDWKQVSAGVVHTCATKKGGRLYCWGNDSNGRIGDGTVANPQFNPFPVQVVGAATDWKQPSAGSAHTCANKTTGRLHCWGRDRSGELGDGTVANPADVPFPVLPVGAATDWKQVSAGAGHTCATKTSRLLLCWGADVSGELGDGTVENPNPDAVPSPVVAHP